MLNEGRQARREWFGQALLTDAGERASHEQRAGVVIYAIAMGTVGNRMNRMLEQPGVVTHG